MGDNDLEKSQIARHDQLLQQHAKDIEEIKDVTYGLPQTLEKITYVVTELSANMKEMGNDFKEFLRVADKKYQTKEMCEMCREDLAKRVDDLEKKNEKLQWGVMGSLALIAWEFFKTYIVK